MCCRFHAFNITKITKTSHVFLAWFHSYVLTQEISGVSQSDSDGCSGDFLRRKEQTLIREQYEQMMEEANLNRIGMTFHTGRAMISAMISIRVERTGNHQDSAGCYKHVDLMFLSFGYRKRCEHVIGTYKTLVVQKACTSLYVHDGVSSSNFRGILQHFACVLPIKEAKNIFYFGPRDIGVNCKQAKPYYFQTTNIHMRSDVYHVVS